MAGAVIRMVRDGTHATVEAALDALLAAARKHSLHENGAEELDGYGVPLRILPAGQRAVVIRTDPIGTTFWSRAARPAATSAVTAGRLTHLRRRLRSSTEDPHGSSSTAVAALRAAVEDELGSHETVLPGHPGALGTP